MRSYLVELSQVTEIATMLAGFATTALVIFVWYQIRQTQQQLKMTKQQMDSSLRPWIGITNTILYDESITFDMFNYGQLPTVSAKIRAKIEDTEFTEEDVISSDVRLGEDLGVNLSVIFPQSHKTLAIVVDREKFIQARAGQISMFVGIAIEYTYANSLTGEYGFIGKFDRQSTSFLIMHEWTR